jgi:hypothetical protein
MKQVNGYHPTFSKHTLSIDIILCLDVRGGGKMQPEMQKALILAENIIGFMKFVQNQRKNNNFRMDNNKLLQIKFLIEEYKFQIVADELIRINQFEWDEKYTLYLVDQFQKGINIIDEYVKNNYNELFIVTARLHTLKNLVDSFRKITS